MHLRSIALAIATMPAFTACAPGGHRFTEADVAAIRALSQQFAQAIVAHDFDRAVAQRTEDLVWMPPKHPSCCGQGSLAPDPQQRSAPDQLRRHADSH